MITKEPGLSNLQMELLKLYSNDIPEKDLLEIKEMLANFFAKKATESMDKFWDEKGLKEEDMEKWANEHNRA